MSRPRSQGAKSKPPTAAMLGAALFIALSSLLVRLAIIEWPHARP